MKRSLAPSSDLSAIIIAVTCAFFIAACAPPEESDGPVLTREAAVSLPVAAGSLTGSFNPQPAVGNLEELRFRSDVDMDAAFLAWEKVRGVGCGDLSQCFADYVVFPEVGDCVNWPWNPNS